MLHSVADQGIRLPMSDGQPDFVFADPETGVVAIKRGTDILYVSLYWRARYAVNFLARVHYLTLSIERDATVYVATAFKDSGMYYTMPDQTDMAYNRRFEQFYQDQGMHFGMAGQKQPIARIPSDNDDFKPGKENIHAGKGDQYLLVYGPYLVAMNCKSTRSLDVPDEFIGSKNIVTGELQTSSKVTVPTDEPIVPYREQ